MLTLIAECYGKRQDFCLLETLAEMKAGSMPGNHIYLPYKGVSRSHFSVVRTTSGWILRDLASRNGTYLNGALIEEAALGPGDEIRAGIVKLLVMEASSRDDAILLPQVRRAPRKRDTEELASDQDLDSTGAGMFYFPHLTYPEGMITGQSPLMQEVYRKLHSIADSDVNVLFIGETGTGKEMLARTLHLSSPRASGPFVAVNCAAIPQDLAESELFGIGEKVATNVGRRAGKLEMAHRGTLLLDELSSFPMPLQAKILRALEEKIIYPVGDNNAHPADFRVLATTNEEPQDLIRTARLREDLYHRVATLELRVPPLRERSEDIESLVVGLISQAAERENKPIAGLKISLLERLRQYSYPGNVRELANVVKSMVALANSGDILDESLLPEKIRSQRDMAATGAATPQQGNPALPLHAYVDDVTRDLIRRALEVKGGNIAQAAEHLGVTPRGLRKMMQRLGLER